MNAPIALFVYKRPAHLRRVYESLLRCPEFLDSDLFVFADGAKGPADAAGVAAVRQLVRSLPHPRLQVAAREHNIGLAESIIAGVSGLCSSHGRVIVVEDDLELSPAFLAYMNAALERYADEPRVMHVSGYSYSTRPLNTTGHAVLLPFTHPWGWATWDRAWRLFDAQGTGWREVIEDRATRRRFNLGGVENFTGMLEQQMTGHSDSWWVRWYLTVFRLDGLGVFPPVSAVDNIGFDRQATHGVMTARLLNPRHQALLFGVPLMPCMDESHEDALTCFTDGMRPTLRRALRLLGKLRHELRSVRYMSRTPGSAARLRLPGLSG